MKRHKIKKAIKTIIAILFVVFALVVIVIGIKTAKGETSQKNGETTTHANTEYNEITTEDPYHAKDYDNAEDFYNYNEGIFYDQNDAEIYWENNQ